MAWLDDQGIAHDGEPPVGYWHIGGRWYDLDETSDRDRSDHRDPVLALL